MLVASLPGVNVQRILRSKEGGSSGQPVLNKVVSTSKNIYPILVWNVIHEISSAEADSEINH